MQQCRDIDLLVDALPGATLFDLGGLQDELESLLGLHVDLLTPGDLPPKFRAKVLAEALLQIVGGDKLIIPFC
ncbi:nucleotidyltransferase family protein [Klebsiella michiganensis]|uniref:nucleotidyltransferase family protein n=1 Tax=Klebsiella TaxID=570 RepID=UPI003F657617